MPEAQEQPNQDPKPSGLREARVIWGQLRTQLLDMEETILKLIRHPETTPEQLLAAHEVYKGTHAALVDMQAMLQSKYPSRSQFAPVNIWSLGGRDSAYNARREG